MFGKTYALNDVLCFQTKFKGGPYSNSAIKLPIQPSELIKKHAHKSPIPDAGHVHEEMLQLQITSQGSSHTHVTARKACQTVCIINHSLSHMHGCANWCHETSEILSMDNWLNAVCHCECRSHTQTFITATLTCISFKPIFPFITNYLIGSIHFSTILKENLYHLLMPVECWYVQRSATILRSPTWSANKCCTISISCPIFSHSRKRKHNIDCIKAQHIYLVALGNMLFLLAEHIDAQMSQKMIIPWRVWQKQCSQRHSLLSKKIPMQSVLKLSNKASYSTLRPHQKACTQVHHHWCRPAPWENASTANHILGELTYSHQRKRSMPIYVHH